MLTKERLPLGKIISRLLAEALARRGPRPDAPRLVWNTRRMTSLVDLADKEALHAVLDRPKA